MEGLTICSSKIFSQQKTTRRVFLFAETLFDKPQKCSFLSRNLITLDFFRSFPLHFKAIESAQSSCFPLETQVGWETTGDEAQASSPSKNVHVKFQLQKECAFGQKFLLVGDDPVVGLWDPLNAVPLEWSDGHIWTIELDFPVGKSVHFKFVLEGPTGEVVWQPGPDRLVQTWETENTIIVLEDWENAKIQKITESRMKPIMESVATEKLPYPNVEGVATENERLIVAENIFCPKEEPMATVGSELIEIMAEQRHLHQPLDLGANIL